MKSKTSVRQDYEVGNFQKLNRPHIPSNHSNKCLVHWLIWWKLSPANWNFHWEYWVLTTQVSEEVYELFECEDCKTSNETCQVSPLFGNTVRSGSPFIIHFLVALCTRLNSLIKSNTIWNDYSEKLIREWNSYPYSNGIQDSQEWMLLMIIIWLLYLVL